MGLLNRDFGSILSFFPRKNSKTQSSLNSLQSGPRKFTKSDFSGLAPIRRVLIDAISGFMTNFLRLIDVNAGGFRLKKGQAI